MLTIRELREATPSRVGNGRRNIWKRLAIATAALLILWVAVRTRTAWTFDWHLFQACLASLHWRWVVFALIPVAATYYGRALRWAVFLNPMKTGTPMGNLISANVIGFAAIALLGRPGELVRPYLIALDADVSVASQLSICVLERVFDLVMALLLFGFGVRRIHSAAAHVGPQMARILESARWFVVAASLALMAALIALRHVRIFIHRVENRCNSFHWRRFAVLRSRLLEFAHGLEAAGSDRAIIAAGVYSAVIWIAIAAFYWCVVRAFDATAGIPVADVLMLSGFVAFGGIVQLPGIGGGVQMVTILVLTEVLEVRLEVAASVAMLVWMLNLTAVPVGIGMAAKKGLNWGRLRSGLQKSHAA